MDEKTVYGTLIVSQFCEKKIGRELTDDECMYIIDIMRNWTFVASSKNIITLSRYLIEHFKNPHYDVMPVLINTVLDRPNLGKLPSPHTSLEMRDYMTKEIYSKDFSIADKNDRYFRPRPIKWQSTEDDVGETKVINANLASRAPEQVMPAIEAVVKSLYNIVDTHLFQRIFVPRAQYKYVYVLLDTSNALNVNGDGTIFQWNFVTNANIQPGVVNAIGKVRDLVAVRCYPVKANYDLTTGLPPGHYNNFVNLNNNFTILIQEFAPQSYIGRDGRRFHFALFPVLMNPLYAGAVVYSPTDPYYEYVTTGKGNGWFYFRTPIVSFSTLTVSMADPFGLIKLSNTVRTLIPLMFVYLNDTDQEL